MSRFVVLVLIACVLAASPASAGCPVGDLNLPPVLILESVPPDCCYGSWAGDIVGRVMNVHTDSVYVTGWAQTDRYYVQPWADSRRFTVVNCDGTFRIASRGGHHYCVVLFKRGGWSAPTPIVSLPPVGGAILGVACSPIPRYLQAFGSPWEVKTSGSVRVGPGPNYFSDSTNNVWVDENGHLHLNTTVINGQAHCAEVVLLGYTGYGIYRFSLRFPGWPYDACTVLAGFLYQNDSNELDIEYSRWCGTVNANAQFVVQPWNVPGNLNRFTVPPPEGERTHEIVWARDCVTFRIREGGAGERGLVLQEWTYRGSNIPAPGEMRFRFNNWQFEGRTPADGQSQELIVTSFSFEPIPGGCPPTAIVSRPWSAIKALYR